MSAGEPYRIRHINPKYHPFQFGGKVKKKSASTFVPSVLKPTQKGPFCTRYHQWTRRALEPLWGVTLSHPQSFAVVVYFLPSSARFQYV